MKATKGISLDIKMVWNKPAMKWFMIFSKNGKFINDFFDCQLISKVFRGLSKEEPKRYIITIKEVV